MKSRHPWVWVLGFVAFVMNPAFACSSAPEDDEFEYGEAEMVGAVQGIWRLTFTRADGVRAAIDVSIQKGPLSAPARAPQCGTRTFTRPASACSPSSELVLAASIVAADPSLEFIEGKGSYVATGIKFGGGRFNLTFDPNLRVSAVVLSDRTARDVTVLWEGAQTASPELVRVLDN